MHHKGPRFVNERELLPKGLGGRCSFGWCCHARRYGVGLESIIRQSLFFTRIHCHFFFLDTITTATPCGGSDDADGLAVIVCLFHEEEQKHEGDGAEDGGDVEDPSIAYPVIDEAADDGREEITARERPGVPAQIRAPLVREEQVGDRRLGQGLDRRGEEARQDRLRDPLAVAARIGAPYRDGRQGREREEIGEALAVLEGEGLPEEQAPAEEEEHVARAGVEVGDGDGEGRRQGHDDRVHDREGDAVEPRVQQRAGERQGLALRTPVQRVFRVRGRRRHQHDVPLIRGVARRHRVLQVDEMDGAWN